MLSRRTMLTGSLLAAPALLSLRAAADDAESAPKRELAALERRHGGRLGVAILDSASDRLVSQRGDERFALCSTFKFLAAAFVLVRVDRGEESLSRRVVYSKSDLVTYSPTTEKHVESGLTIGEMTFDWEPQTPAGQHVALTGRGTDARLERTDRVGADQRKAARRQRRERGDES